jgi:hypothetical protein
MKHKLSRLLHHPVLKHSRFSRANLLIFILIFAGIGGYMLYTSLAASLPNVYISQAGAGTIDGSSCTNAQSATFFNTQTNWGANSSQIGPGTTVHLCGIISSPLTARGSGTNGLPITIHFENGAKISMPYCPSSGCMDFSNRSYITVDGGANGIIEGTANGSNLANQQPSTGIVARSCNNCTIKNLTIQNIFIHVAPANDVANNTTRCINFSGSHWHIENNVMHDADWCLVEGVSPGGDDIHISNNEIYNINHGWAPSGTTSDNLGSFFFHNNHIHDMANWDSAQNWYHHDGIHCYAIPLGGMHFTGLYIYDNTFDGDQGENVTAWIFLEHGQSAQCADPTSNVNIFNNKLIYGGTRPSNGNGIISVSDGQGLMVNNWIQGNDHDGLSPSSVCSGAHSGAIFENNVLAGCDYLISGDQSGATVNYNAYSLCSSPFHCVANQTIGTSNFAAYQAAGFEPNSVANFAAAAGSNASGVGKNLTSLCTGYLVPLCEDINGKPRPATGPWDAGAVQSTTANVFISPNGSDTGSNCKRFTLVTINPDPGGSSLCATWQKAYNIAQQGDTVGVMPGEYCSTGCAPVAVDKDITKNTDGSYVTFTCTSNEAENVTFGISNFVVWADHVKIDGAGDWRAGIPSCMRFPAIFTYGGDTHWVKDMVVRGVHAQSLQMQGANNFLASNNELGPSIACHEQSWPVTSQRCQNNAETGEAWYYNHPALKNCGEESDTHIGSAGNPQSPHTGTNITFTYNWVHDDNTRDAGNCHTGGMSSHGNVDGLIISHNKFEQHIVYDLTIHGSLSNVLIENNWFGTNVASFENGCSYHTCGEVNNGFAIYIDNRTGANNFTNWLVRYNTSTQGVVFHNGAITNTYSNFRWIGNLMAGMECDSYILGNPGVTIDRNALVGSICGTNSTNLLSLGVKKSTGYPINFDLTNTAALPQLPNNGADYFTATDYHGANRTYPTLPGATISSIGSGGTSVPGDLNNDSHVTITDLSILLSHYGQAGQTLSTGDCNNDGAVTVTDLSILLSHYGA